MNNFSYMFSSLTIFTKHNIIDKYKKYFVIYYTYIYYYTSRIFFFNTRNKRFLMVLDMHFVLKSTYINT